MQFGGGFYCGSVDGIFVINGFYMSMRGKYTNPPAKIQYYLVEVCFATLHVMGCIGMILPVSAASRRYIGVCFSFPCCLLQRACLSCSLTLLPSCHPNPFLRAVCGLVSQWDPATLSWEDFRVKVLGATNPSEAAEGSVRREIYNNWEKLGLASKPNVGDNGANWGTRARFPLVVGCLQGCAGCASFDGQRESPVCSPHPPQRRWVFLLVYCCFRCVSMAPSRSLHWAGVHASASPFEAMAERCNWVGASVQSDVYGRGMIAAGVPVETIVAWSSDPQVKSGAGKSSLFDLLEDMNAGDCLAKSAAIHGEQ